MIATLFVEYADGTTADVCQRRDVEDGGCMRRRVGRSSDFDDVGLEAAAAESKPRGAEANPLGHPWIPDAVKALRHAFEVKAPVKSARLYATALGRL